MEKKRKKVTQKMKSLHRETAKHLSEDIKGYQKERKYLKKEIQEDRELKKKFKVSTNGRSKRKISTKKKK